MVKLVTLLLSGYQQKHLGCTLRFTSLCKIEIFGAISYVRLRPGFCHNFKTETNPKKICA